MNPVAVVAVIRAKKGKDAQLEMVLRELVVATHQEPGCLLYALHRSAAQGGVFVFVEKWRSQRDLEDHLAASHIGKAMAKKEELIESLEILPLEAISVDKSSMESFAHID